MSGPPPSSPPTVVAKLTQPGGVKRLLRTTAENKLTFTPQEIVVEHAMLRAPLRFAPGSVVVASVDAGAAKASKDVVRGRFPILHRLAPNRVLPRSEGIEGWIWTSTDGSAFTTLTDDFPNVAFILSPPIPSERLEACFEPNMLAELAKRSPLGQPALFGLLLSAERPLDVDEALERFGLKGEITDREVPPVQRRHLPDDKPANPTVRGVDTGRERTSMPPPGMG